MLKIVLRNTLRKNPFQDSGAFLGEVKEIKNMTLVIIACA